MFAHMIKIPIGIRRILLKAFTNPFPPWQSLHNGGEHTHIFFTKLDVAKEQDGVTT